MKKQQALISLLIVGAVFTSMVLAAWLLPSKDFSDSERRRLAQRPEFSLSSVKSGRFMSEFEKYTQDQFPLRDKLRMLKAVSVYDIFGRLDNNGIYIKDGYAAKLEYPLEEDSVTHAAKRLAYVYEKYLADKSGKVYLSIVPDKSYFLAGEDYLSMDYNRLIELMRQGMPFAEYIDIIGTLDISYYYKTDTHWRQEKIPDTAARLAAAMGASLSGQYTQNKLDRPFHGVYYGQSAMPLPGEEIVYLTNSVLDGCIATDHESGTVGGLYDMDKAAGKDPYELFLSGALPLVTVENPNAKNDRELVLFRDSFGSSIAPLLAEGYAKITLVDTRYLRADQLDKFIDFHGQDVLFLYSTLLLNSSSTLT